MLRPTRFLWLGCIVATGISVLACSDSEKQQFRSSCDEPSSQTATPGKATEVEVGAVTFYLAGEPSDDVTLDYAGPDRWVAKMPLVVKNGPGAVVALSGAEISTGAPVSFEYTGEVVRAAVTFTVPSPVGQNAPGAVPGSMHVEELGIYEVAVVVDGVDQGMARFAFCRSL